MHRNCGIQLVKKATDRIWANDYLHSLWWVMWSKPKEFIELYSKVLTDFSNEKELFFYSHTNPFIKNVSTLSILHTFHAFISLKIKKKWNSFFWFYTHENVSECMNVSVNVLNELSALEMQNNGICNGK